MMVDLVVAGIKMYEKVDEALAILWWKPKNWTALKIIRLLRKPVWDMFVCLFVSVRSTKNDTKNANKKWREGWLIKFRMWRCLSLQTIQCFCQPDGRNDNGSKIIANWTQHATLTPFFSQRAWIRKSFPVGRWVLTVWDLKSIIPWWWWWMNSRLWLCVSPLLFTC